MQPVSAAPSSAPAEPRGSERLAFAPRVRQRTISDRAMLSAAMHSDAVASRQKEQLRRRQAWAQDTWATTVAARRDDRSSTSSHPDWIAQATDRRQGDRAEKRSLKTKAITTFRRIRSRSCATCSSVRVPRPQLVPQDSAGINRCRRRREPRSRGRLPWRREFILGRLVHHRTSYVHGMDQLSASTAAA